MHQRRGQAGGEIGGAAIARGDRMIAGAERGGRVGRYTGGEVDRAEHRHPVHEGDRTADRRDAGREGHRLAGRTRIGGGGQNRRVGAASTTWATAEEVLGA